MYLPVILENGSRSFSDVIVMLPRWSDFFNVSFDNLVWGDMLRSFFPETRPVFWELRTGFPIITLLTFFGYFFYVLKRFLKHDFNFDIRIPLVV